MPVRSHGQISCVRLRTGVHYPEKLPEGLPPRTLGVEHVVGATVTGTGENMRRGQKHAITLGYPSVCRRLSRARPKQ